MFIFPGLSRNHCEGSAGLTLKANLGSCALTLALHYCGTQSERSATRQPSIQNRVMFTVCLVLSKSSQEGEVR